MYTKKQIDNIYKYIKVIVDSREQENQHILNFFEENKIDYEIKKLDFGDYSFTTKENDIIGKINFEKFIAIERKNGLLEFSRNAFRDKERFERELQRKEKACFTLLIENCEGFEDITKGYYRKRKSIISIETLIKKLERLDKKRVNFDVVNNFLYDLNYYIPKTNANSFKGVLMSLEQRYKFNTIFIQNNNMSGQYIFDRFKYYLMEVMKKKNKIKEKNFLAQ